MLTVIFPYKYPASNYQDGRAGGGKGEGMAWRGVAHAIEANI